MHRSGTSVLAGCLNLMGLNLGYSLMPGDVSNLSGYYENQDIVLAHDILLRGLGCRWDMVGTLPENWEQSQAADKAQETISEIIEHQYLNQDVPFVIKDPRMCRLMPLWKRLLNQLSIQTSLVFMLRHPMEVAKSLKERNNFDLLQGHLLWLVHNREALAAGQDLDHMLITFDQLLADPITTLASLTNLPILSNLDPYPYSQDLLQFTRPELKHHHQGNSKGNLNGLFSHYAWIYDQFRSLQAKSQVFNLKSDQEETNNPLARAKKVAEFPLAISESTTLPSTDDRRHAAQVLDNLLNLISRYEQTELDLANQRQRRLLAVTNVAETLFAQVFFPRPKAKPGEYTEEDSKKILLAPGEWQQLKVDIPNPETLQKNRLRLDPLNTRGLASLSAIKLVNRTNGQICWSAEEQFSQISVKKDALILSRDNSLELVTTGNDPSLLLPELPDLPDCPMYLEVWIKAVRSQESLTKYWQEMVQNREELLAKQEELIRSRDKIQAELEELKKELDQKKKSLQQEQADKDQLQKQVQDLENQLEKKEQSEKQVSHELDKLKNELAEQKKSWQKETEDKDKSIKELENSLQAQKDLTLEYFTVLSQTEKEQEELREEYSSQVAQLQDQLRAKEEELNRQLEQFQSRQQQWQDQLQAKEEELNSQLEQFESRHQELQDQLQAKDEELQDQIQAKDQSVSELQEQLQSQKDLTIRYFHALAKAEKDQDQLRQKLWQLKEQNKKLKTWMQQLHKDLQALLGSARWKLGNFAVRTLEVFLLRPRKSMAVDHMQDIFTSFNNKDWKIDLARARPEKAQDRGKQLVHWLGLLQKDFLALKSSLRWKVGQATMRTVEIMLFRGKPGLAIDHMQQIFDDFEKWKENNQSRIKASALSSRDIKQLQRWLNQLEADFEALIKSMRWKVGQATMRVVEVILLRKKRPIVIDHMQGIFDNYHQRI